MISARTNSSLRRTIPPPGSGFGPNGTTIQTALARPRADSGSEGSLKNLGEAGFGAFLARNLLTNHN